MQELLKIVPLFSGVSALIATFALWVTAYQLVNAIRWNRVTSAFTYFPNPLTLETLENELDDTIRFWSSKQPLTSPECRLLLFQGELNADERGSVIKEVRATLFSLGRETDADDRIFLQDMRKTGRKLKAYLNELERYAAAINSGVVDDHTAHRIYKAKFIGHHDKIRELIRYVQAARGVTVYSEFNLLAERWRQPEAVRSAYPAKLLDLFRSR